MCHAHRAVHKDGRRAVCDKLETVVGRLLTTLAMTVDVRAVANFFSDSLRLLYTSIQAYAEGHTIPR